MGQPKPPKPYSCQVCQVRVTDFESVVVTTEDDTRTLIAIEYTVQPCGDQWAVEVPHG